MVPAQIFAMENTCDMAVAAIAWLAPQLQFKVGVRRICFICRKLQPDQVHQPSVGICVAQFLVLQRIHEQTDAV